MSSLKQKISDLYEPNNKDTIWFTYSLLVFDLVMVVYLSFSSFYHGNNIIESIDYVIGAIILSDFLARFYISKNKLRYFINPFAIIDMIVIVSLLFPATGELFAFLRVTRVVAVLRSPYLMDRVRQDFKFFVMHEEVIKSSTNLFVFVFLTTSFVFQTQVGVNDKITNYLDALYFTITTLTTTGFGDVTLVGSHGKLIAIIIMVFGVSLFIRLIQTIYKPNKVRHECKNCGLFLHDRDASHCKACGNIIDIPDEGLV